MQSEQLVVLPATIKRVSPAMPWSSTNQKVFLFNIHLLEKRDSFFLIT